MSGVPIAPLALPTLPEARTAGRPGAGRRRRLTLAALPVQRLGSLVYDFAAVDRWGRLVARAALGSLGWPAGFRIDIREQGGLIVITADPAGTRTVDKRGHLRLPASLYRWFRLHTGTRVLAVGDPDRQRLVIHPLAALDVIVGRQHAEILDGGDA